MITTIMVIGDILKVSGGEEGKVGTASATPRLPGVSPVVPRIQGGQPPPMQVWDSHEYLCPLCPLCNPDQPMFNRSTSDARATHHRLLSPSRDAIRPAHPERGRETETRSSSNVGRTSGRQRLLRTFPGLHRTQLRHLLTYLTAQVVQLYNHLV